MINTNIRGNSKMVSIYKHALRHFWHSPGIEPVSFWSQVEHATAMPRPPPLSARCCRGATDLRYVPKLQANEQTDKFVRRPTWRRCCRQKGWRKFSQSGNFWHSWLVWHTSHYLRRNSVQRRMCYTRAHKNNNNSYKTNLWHTWQAYINFVSSWF